VFFIGIKVKVALVGLVMRENERWLLAGLKNF